MSTVDVLAGVIAAHTAITVALAIGLIRTREKVTRLEEWARLIEKWRNGGGPQDR